MVSITEALVEVGQAPRALEALRVVLIKTNMAVPAEDRLVVGFSSTKLELLVDMDVRPGP
jgi:hypothetical protein